MADIWWDFIGKEVGLVPEITNIVAGYDRRGCRHVGQMVCVIPGGYC